MTSTTAPTIRQRQQLAASRDLTPAVAVALADDPEIEVLAQLATNPALPPDGLSALLDRAAADHASRRIVLAMLAGNPALTEPELDLLLPPLLADPDETLLLLLAHRGCTPALAERLLVELSSVVDARRGLAALRTNELHSLVALHLAGRPDLTAATRAHLVETATTLGSDLVGEALAERTDLTADERSALLNAPRSRVHALRRFPLQDVAVTRLPELSAADVAAALTNPTLDPAEAASLSAQWLDSAEVGARLALDPALPPALARELDARGVRIPLTHPALPRHRLVAALGDEDVSVVLRALLNPGLRPDDVTPLRHDPRPAVRRQVQRLLAGTAA